MNLAGLKATLQIGGAYLRVKGQYFVYSVYANLLGWLAVGFAAFSALDSSSSFHRWAVAVIAVLFALKTYYDWLDAKAGRPLQD